MTKVFYIFDGDDLANKTYEWKTNNNISTHFEVSNFTMISASEDCEDYSIDLVTGNGDFIAKGLTREEYDDLPDALKENVIAYEVLSVRVRMNK